MIEVTELAGQYLVAGNAITAFYVIQTILFLNNIHQSPTLLSALCNEKSNAIVVTFITAIIYMAAM